MKLFILVVITILSLMTIPFASAENKKAKYGRTYGDTWYELEKKYPSPERRYSRKELDQARRRAGNSLWMEKYGRKDPIYRSDQYRGQSSRGYGYRQPYRYNRYGHRW